MAEGFANSIIGGAETLIRSAIKSVNYVLGVAGWRISRTGSAEFNDATVRGSISAGGGTVLLNAGGLHIQGVTTQYDINTVAGFIARDSPDDGTQAQMVPGGFFLTPDDPSPLGTAVDFASWFVGYDNPGAANEAPFAEFQGVEYSGKTAPTISMIGQAANDANPDNTSQLNLAANNVNISVGSTRPGFVRGEYGSFLLSFGPAASATVTVTYAKTYSVAPIPVTNIDSGAGVTLRWSSKVRARTTTQFDYFVYATDGVANTWVNIPVSWYTLEPV